MHTVNHNSSERQRERADVSFMIRTCRALKRLRTMNIISDRDRDAAVLHVLPKRMRLSYRNGTKLNRMKEFAGLDRYSDESYNGL